MATKNEIDALKNKVTINQYLQSRGLECESESFKNFVFFSPLTEETGTPSFMVNKTGTGFNDFSSGEKGDIFKLVMLLEKLDFAGAYNFVKNFDGSIIDLPKIRTPKINECTKEPTIKRVTEIYNTNLLNYANDRCISTDVLTLCVSEVHYTANNKNFYGLGYCNNMGGWEIRNKNFKGCIGKKWFNEFFNVYDNDILVFEGLFDFLSLVEYKGLDYYRRKNFVVLNSLNNWKVFYEKYNWKFDKYHLCLDNDKAGKKLTDKLVNEDPKKFKDCSKFYAPHNDFNDWLVNYKRSNTM